MISEVLGGLKNLALSTLLTSFFTVGVTNSVAQVINIDTTGGSIFEPFLRKPPTMPTFNKVEYYYELYRENGNIYRNVFDPISFEFLRREIFKEYKEDIDIKNVGWWLDNSYNNSSNQKPLIKNVKTFSKYLHDLFSEANDSINQKGRVEICDEKTAEKVIQQLNNRILETYIESKYIYDQVISNTIRTHIKSRFYFSYKKNEDNTYNIQLTISGPPQIRAETYNLAKNESNEWVLVDSNKTCFAHFSAVLDLFMKKTPNDFKNYQHPFYESVELRYFLEKSKDFSLDENLRLLIQSVPYTSLSKKDKQKAIGEFLEELCSFLEEELQDGAKIQSKKNILTITSKKGVSMELKITNLDPFRLEVISAKVDGVKRAAGERNGCTASGLLKIISDILEDKSSGYNPYVPQGNRAIKFYKTGQYPDPNYPNLVKAVIADKNKDTYHPNQGELEAMKG